MDALIRWTSPDNESVKIEWNTGSDIFKIYEHGSFAWRGSNQAVPEDYTAAEKVAKRLLRQYLDGQLPRRVGS